VINRLKAELVEKTAVIDALDAEVKSLSSKIHEGEREYEVKTAAFEANERALAIKEAELAKAASDINEQRLATDTQRIEIAVLKLFVPDCVALARLLFLVISVPLVVAAHHRAAPLQPLRGSSSCSSTPMPSRRQAGSRTPRPPTASCSRLTRVIPGPGTCSASGLCVPATRDQR
jgi:hypothetical protein